MRATDSIYIQIWFAGLVAGAAIGALLVIYGVI